MSIVEPPRRAPLSRLIAYSHSHRRTVWLAAACSVLNKLFDLAPPLLIGAAVDIVVRREASLLAQAGVESPLAQLVWLGVITFIVWGLESVFEYVYKVLWRNLAQTVQHELRMDAYTHVQSLDLGFHEHRSTGELIAVLNDDVNQLERFLDGGANALIQVATTVVAIGALFFVLAPTVAWMAVLPMPLIVWGSVRFQRHLEPRYRAVRERAGQLSRHLQQNLSGIATIQSFAREAHERDRLTRESEAYRETNRGAIALSSLFAPVIRMVIVIGFLAMMVAGGWLTLEGRLGVGAYSVLVFLTQRLLWPLTRLGETFDLYQRAMASTERALDLLDQPRGITGGATKLPIDGVRGEVRFEDVSLSYPGREPTLTSLSITVGAGETVAVVGATGAGKTTLVKLLNRFYDVSAGRVLVDGEDVRDLDLTDLRRAIGVVSQDVFLFDGTVAENLRYGALDASDADLERVSRLAEAHDFIAALPERYDTRIGERGVRLSGGQRQRLSIARALLKDPPILVFDEATSSVDNETEAAIQRSLDRVSEGRTTLVIAHRLSTVRNADRIYVLEAGRVREQGCHEDLVAADGLYASLWRVQTGDRARSVSAGAAS